MVGLLKIDLTDRNRTYAVPEKPSAVWRYLRSGKPSMPVDHRLLQWEDEMHDWSWRSGRFRYSGTGFSSTRENWWLVLEYESPEKVCPSCGATVDGQASFCPSCGSKIATKSESEKEEEEAERLVRKSPKKKPPRRDKERGQVEVGDRDTDEDDPDMSMNYKDIGGSVLMACMVASMHLSKMTEDEFLEKRVENPDTGNEVKLKTLQNEPEDSPAGKVYQREYEKWKGDSPDEEDGKTNKGKKPQKVKPIKPSPVKEEPEETDPLEDLRKADLEDLYEVALSEHSSPEEAQKALELLSRKKRVIPHGFVEVSEFKGKLDDDELKVLKEHAKDWDAHTYAENIKALSENWHQAFFEGNERDSEYFQEIKDAYQSVEDRISPRGLGDVSVKDLLGEDLDQPLTDEYERRLPTQKAKWFTESIYTPLNDLKSKLEELNQIDTVEGSKGDAYHAALGESLSRMIDRKELDSDMPTDSFLIAVRDHPSTQDPGDVNFTDRKERKEFVTKLRHLSDTDLAAIARSAGGRYEARLGIDQVSENPSISSAKRAEFFSNLEDDVALKGFFAQVHLKDESGGELSKEAMIRLLRHIRENKPPGHEVYTSLADFLFELAQVTAEELEKRVISMSNAKAFQRALRKAGITKQAQYRGLPGPLSDEDAYKPPQPKWRLPRSTQDLNYDDYVAIVASAREWLHDSFLSHVAVEFDYDMSCEMALDYAIYSANDFKYNGSVGEPLFQKLLIALKRIEASDSE